MSSPPSPNPAVRFGQFVVDMRAAEIYRNGTKVRLQGQPFEVLKLLLACPGRMVTRDELRRRLWPSDAFVDFDQSLNKAVNRLREALGDSTEQPALSRPSRGVAIASSPRSRVVFQCRLGRASFSGWESQH